ncbi:MAG: hypothetical protein IPG01_04995 [Chitinophagaceae bacterium]|nr:hypothetical protein [Chitinophagaceae bacterium]
MHLVAALTDSANATDYLKKLRTRDADVGVYIGTNCPQVEMLSNGKKRKTLAGNVRDIFRINHVIFNMYQSDHFFGVRHLVLLKGKKLAPRHEAAKK